MRTFNETQIEEFLKWTNKNVLPLEEVEGRCHICGEFLSDIELPKGPEKKVVCLKDREYFVKSYEEIVSFGGFE